MKKFILLLLWWMPTSFISAQEKVLPVKADIRSVLVYLQGAVVQRSGQVSLSSGRSELVLAKVSNEIEPQSIQVEMDADITILSVGTRKNFLHSPDPGSGKQDLQQEIDRLSSKILQTQKMQEVYKQDETMLLRNQEVRQGQGSNRATEMKSALDFQHAKLEEIFRHQLQLETQVRELEKEKTRLVAQLQEINQHHREMVQEIYALVETGKPVTTRIGINYLVKKAGWYPTYNISVKDISSPLDISLKANLYQSSGEEWKNVKISLSTGDPGENMATPEITPWYLRYVDLYPPVSFNPTFNSRDQVMGRLVDSRNVPITGASILLKGTTTGTTSDVNGIFRLNGLPNTGVLTISSVGYQGRELMVQKGFITVMLEEQISALEEVVVTGYGATGDSGGSNQVRLRGMSTLAGKSKGVSVNTIYQPVTTRFDIQETYTIQPDGKVNMIDIKRISIPAGYSYYAAPKLEQAAFLTAKVVNWQSLDLLAGEASLFYEGTYLGKSFLDPATTHDTLELALGKDKGVIVERKLVGESSSKRLIGSNKTDGRVFEWSIRNNKSTAVSILVEDQYPISVVKEIEVDEKGHGAGLLNETTKVISWHLVIEPNSERKDQIKYTVKYPKDKQIQLY